MKSLLTFVCFISFAALCYSQAPQKVNYQGVVRDANGSIKPNNNIGIQLRLHYDDSSGQIIYQENHAIVTNNFGLFNIQIGTGSSTQGQFSQIDWGNHSVFAEVLMDINGGNEFSSLGSQEIVSVPYALYAEKAGNSTSYSAGNGIQINGNVISNIGDTNPFDDIITTTVAGGDINGTFNDLQISSNVITSLEISDGSIGSNDLNNMGATNGQVLKWNGTAWVPEVDMTGSTAINGTENYIPKFTNNGTAIGNSILYDKGGNIGVGTSVPDDKVDIIGNSQISGYLKIGDPSIPDSVLSFTALPLYKLSHLSGSEGWSQNNDCGGTAWFIDVDGVNAGVIYFTSSGSYHRAIEFSPWIWIPSGTTHVTVEGTFNCNLENNEDGVFLEYLINGETWTKITNFDFGAYPGTASGCNTTCNGSDQQECWTGIFDTKCFRVNKDIFPSNIAGNWIRFRFIAMEDSSIGGSRFELRGFNVTAFRGPKVGGVFSPGNIYAEKNIYAGSNVLIGDIAEFFNIESTTEPGDLISISSDEGDSYSITSTEYDNNIFGIHSSNPTITLNAPIGTPVCLAGRVPVKVNSENGPIRIGDYLTSSSIPGIAMKADRPCYIVGRALENYSSTDIGKILCLVEPGWYNPTGVGRIQSGGSFKTQVNSKSTKVFDTSISESSRVFVTFRSNAGNHWISDLQNGFFAVDTEKPSLQSLPFDYFVDNARFSKETINLEGDQLVIPNHTTLNKMETYSEATPPGPPTNPDLPWIWTPKQGFMLSKSN